MTFDEDEMRGQSRRWISKDTGEEEISQEVHTLTPSSVISRISTRYDNLTGSITNEFSVGVCSVCGKPLDCDPTTVQCYYGDLSCGRCKVTHNGRSICRMHVENHLGTKEEAMALISIGFGLTRDETKKITGLSDNSLTLVKRKLLDRTYIEAKSFGLFFNKIKITESGRWVTGVLVSAYVTDSDFRAFLERIGWM
jgi:hypothetical protein